MKRIIALLISLAAVISLASCGAREIEADATALADESYSRALDLYSRGAYVSAEIVIDKAVEEYGPDERFEELRKQVKEAADAALTSTEEYTEESPYERWLTETQPEPVTEPATTAPETTKPEMTAKAATTTKTAAKSTTAKKETTTAKPAPATTKPATKATTKATTTALTTTKPTTHRNAEPLTTKPKGTTTTTAPATSAAPETETGTEAPEEGTTGPALA
ncbi:MAG: hypothetical protein IJK60_00135 [Clostridia bacterium]|nr:hypothetical protein [Clostridia bacterium]